MDNVVTWSFENVVTIFLMVLVGFIALHFGLKLAGVSPTMGA